MMPRGPGTVSKILWHFTGGPLWNAAKGKQQRKPKPEPEARMAMMGILRDKELRLGRYKEVVKVKGWSVEHTKTGKPRLRRNPLETLESAPICCLADIPIAHLHYHAYRYGRMAIGFHRKAAVKHGFSPVLYQLQGSPALQAICDGMELIRIGNSFDVVGPIRILGGLLEKLVAEVTVVDARTDMEFDFCNTQEHHYFIEALNEAGLGGSVVSDGFEKARAILAFIKTFTPNEFGSIYCEREWRATTSFGFGYDDIAMIVLPRRNRCGIDFEDWMAEIRGFPGFPVTIPIVPWEDLVEH